MTPTPTTVLVPDAVPTSVASSRLAIEAELPRLRARARRLCACESDALDLVQDTVLRALVYAHGFEPGSNLFAWLRQIQTSLFVSRYRRLRREHRALERVTFDPCSWVHADGPPPAALVGRAVRRALRDLPESYRRAVELVDLGGLEYRDAARELGVPVGTIMSRLHRGRRQLALRLSEPGDAAPNEPGSLPAPRPRRAARVVHDEVRARRRATSEQRVEVTPARRAA